MKLKLFLCIFTPLVMMSCVSVHPYDQTYLWEDEVTGKSKLTRYADLCHGRPIRLIDIVMLDYPPCLVFSYSIEPGTESVELKLTYAYNLVTSTVGQWFNMQDVWVDGTQIPTNESDRNRILTQRLESMTAFVPLDLFKQWSCREEPVVITTRGQFYNIDERLKIHTMKLFLAKAEELHVVDTTGGCTSRRPKPQKI